MILPQIKVVLLTIIHTEPLARRLGVCLVFVSYICQVEIDTLTGDWHTLRTDLVMDVGATLNPAIDIGQIEGLFALFL